MPHQLLILRATKRGALNRVGILTAAILGLLLPVTAFSSGEVMQETVTVDGVERQAVVYPTRSRRRALRLCLCFTGTAGLRRMWLAAFAFTSFGLKL